MSRRQNQEIIFVCSAVSQTGDLCSQEIIALNSQEAAKLFQQQFKVNAQSIFGPFLKKNLPKTLNTDKINLLGTAFQKAEYNGWLVHAFALKDMPDHSYLLFIKRLDDKKVPLPKGRVIVPFIDLRFI